MGAREQLIDLAAKALDEFAWHGAEWYRRKTADIILGALFSKPAVLIQALADSPCATCGGNKAVVRETPWRDAGVQTVTCDDCTDGRLGMEGVLRLAGYEQVGWALIGRHAPQRGVIDVRSYEIDNLPADSTIDQVPVFAALPKENDQQ